ncbi:ABC transporter ATP-binding protein [Actinomadura nitritigenes]|uniref:ABC transporter ATP-binding protein n=1 Tax=Actinomadura nitritigenes TaxID=134602 RepID=UPI0027DC2F1A|nr:ABC transporter ATP-binding protein [Actinomadura nitritigenes]
MSLQVGDAGVVALLGSNGAGKTTLMRAISGTLPLYGGAVRGGSIRFLDRPVEKSSPAAIVRSGLVQVPEGRHVFGALSVADNLAAGALPVRSRTEREKAGKHVLELFPRLAERLKQPAGTLSGGEQQMLAIGRALMSRPKLLLLDEPSLGLAPRLVEVIAETVRNISREGVPVLLVEQNAAMALSLAKSAYVLELGQVVLQGAADELAASDEVRRLYLGESAGGTVREAVPVPALSRWDG